MTLWRAYKVPSLKLIIKAKKINVTLSLLEKKSNPSIELKCNPEGVKRWSKERCFNVFFVFGLRYLFSPVINAFSSDIFLTELGLYL